MPPRPDPIATEGDDRARRRLAERLKLVTAITRELLGAHTLTEVVDVVTQHLTEATGAAVGSISLLVDQDTLALMGIRGAPAPVASRWATFPLSAHNPGAEALREQQPVVLVGRSAIRERYPDLELITDGERTILCLPLVAGERRLGVVSLSFPGIRELDEAAIGFYVLLADTCAHSVDRIQALEAAEDREAKLAFLSRATERLVSDLDYEASLSAVAEMAVPWFADWCSISIAQDGWLRPLAVAHRQPHLADLVAELQRRFPPSPATPRGPYRVLRTGRTDLIPDLSDEILRLGAQDEEHLELLRRLEFRSVMSCPLEVHGRMLGVITWVAGRDGRRYDENDVSFGEDLARRAAAAIDNAELHSQVNDVALRLQRAILPDELTQVPGFRTAVHYSPAGRTLVGGDFYDVVALPDGRVAAFVGDVMGRGVEAAAIMAQLRATVRTLAALDPTPGILLSRLDAVADTLGLDHLVTLVYALAWPGGAEGGARVEVVSAGHPPPLVLKHDGTNDVLALEPGLVFGAISPDTRPGAFRLDMQPGDRLLMFTDGLVERRDEDPEEGMGRLVAACLGRRVPDAPQAWLDDVVSTVRDPSRDDDVTVLLLVAT